MNGNGRPLTTRMKVRILIAFTLLAWATQTLLGRLSFGAEPPASADAVPAWVPALRAADEQPTLSAERFVTATPRMSAGATLELRAEARVYGGEIRLKQVCRWSDADAAAFLPVADLVVTRLDAKAPFRGIALADIKATLQGAGVNLAIVRFSGPTHCTITRTDGASDAKPTLDKWIDAREAKPPAAEVMAAALVAATPAAHPAAPAFDASPVRSLRQALTADLASRLSLPEEVLQVTFNPKDERALNLSEPQFKFSVQPLRARGLGDVSWEVTIVAATGTQKLSLSATAQAWQDQVVVARPMSARQIIRGEDLTEKRVLVSRIGEEPLLTLAQAIGQQAGRDLKPGAVMTARMVDAVPLAKTGQLITVTLNRGGIRVKTAGRAMGGGSYGHSIQVKNEATKELYDVVLTGPQEGTIGRGGNAE